MPVHLFRNQPELAAKLLHEALNQHLPRYKQVRVDSADLTDVQPAEYRADLVVVLADAAPVLGIIVEVQRSVDQHKRFAWPAYVAGLRARLKCPVWLLVIATSERVARWAGEPIRMGAGSCITPLVLHPSRVPQITDEAQARANPELAVLSAMAHGQDPDIHKAARIALAAYRACRTLDPDRSVMYCDLILESLPEAVAQELKMLDPTTYELRSAFARQCAAMGEAKGRNRGRKEGRREGLKAGKSEGRVELLLRQLTVRFGSVSATYRRRLRTASIKELDRIGERLLTARTLKQVLKAP